MKSPVVIMDCNRNGLASIRSLSKAGYEIIAVDHQRLSPGIYSKHITRLHLITRPSVNEQEFIASLIRISENLKTSEKPFLLPVNDQYVRTLAANWPALSDHFQPLFETDNSMLDYITNKVEFSKFCESINIPRPKEYTISEVEHGNAAHPIIFKPDERNTLENLRADIFKVKISNRHEDSIQFVSFLKANKIEVIIQQLIPGGDDELFTAGVSAYKGKLLACFTGKKVRQFPPMAGQAALAVSIECPKIVEYSKNIVEASGFTGIAQIEFKHYDGEYYVIEMNPRSWSWHGLAIPSGVNLPKILIDAANGTYSKNPPTTNQRNGVYWQYFIEDLYYNVILHKTLTLRQVFSTWRQAEAHAFFDINDIKPAIAHLCIQYPIRLVKWVIGFQDRLSRINLSTDLNPPKNGTDQT